MKDSRRSKGFQRWSAKRKTEAVLRVLREKSSDIVARKLGVKASTLARPWDLFLWSGEKGLKSRPDDPQVVEKESLKPKIGEPT